MIDDDEKSYWRSKNWDDDIVVPDVLKINVKQEERKQNISNTRRLKFATDTAFVKQHKAMVKERSQNSNWLNNVREANEKRSQNPVWQENVEKSNKKMAKDPNWIKSHKKGSEIRSQNLTWRENAKKAGSKRANDANWRENVTTANQTLTKDPKWIEKNTRAHSTPLVTPEGVFDSLVNAAKVYNEIRNFKNGINWVKAQLKQGTPGFKKITWEEYDEIMQK
jgi:hypothetical protein